MRSQDCTNLLSSYRLRLILSFLVSWLEKIFSMPKFWIELLNLFFYFDCNFICCSKSEYSVAWYKVSKSFYLGKRSESNLSVG